MITTAGHLTFCTNIFPGDSWEEHFNALRLNIPLIKKGLAHEGAFGIGLRLSNKASLQLCEGETLNEFQQWLQRENCYVFIINGFPYGNFHGVKVKDQVHFPDWTTAERQQYTLRLCRILAALLPEGLEGGISTSPVSYKYWFDRDEQRSVAMESAIYNMMDVVGALKKIHTDTGKIIHLDLEPEPDGLIESAEEFTDWFINQLLPLGTSILQDRFSLAEETARNTIREHVRLCYDVCHFAVGFERAEEVLKQLASANIKIGRWQLSSALKLHFPNGPEAGEELVREVKQFDEPVYLHQVVARQEDGSLRRYRDLPDALAHLHADELIEWRSHFHVPLFIEKYGLLGSTQRDVIEAMALQKRYALCPVMEIETYTWDVLPHDLKLPVDQSIVREMKWVLSQINDMYESAGSDSQKPEN